MAIGQTWGVSITADNTTVTNFDGFTWRYPKVSEKKLKTPVDPGMQTVTAINTKGTTPGHFMGPETVLKAIDNILAIRLV